MAASAAPKIDISINDTVSKLVDNGNTIETRNSYSTIKDILIFSVFVHYGIINVKSEDITFKLHEIAISVLEKLEIINNKINDLKTLNVKDALMKFKDSEEPNFNIMLTDLLNKTNYNTKTNLFADIQEPFEIITKFIENSQINVYNNILGKAYPSILYLQLVYNISPKFISDFLKSDSNHIIEFFGLISGFNESLKYDELLIKIKEDIHKTLCVKIDFKLTYYFYFVGFSFLGRLLTQIQGALKDKGKSKGPSLQILWKIITTNDNRRLKYLKAIELADNYCMSLMSLQKECSKINVNKGDDIINTIEKQKMSILEHLKNIYNLLRISNANIVKNTQLPSAPPPSPAQPSSPAKTPSTPEGEPLFESSDLKPSFSSFPAQEEKKQPLPKPDIDPLFKLFVQIYTEIGLDSVKASEEALILYKRYDKKKGFEPIAELKNIFKILLDEDMKFNKFKQIHNIKDHEMWKEFIKTVGKLQSLTIIQQIKQPDTPCDEQIQLLIDILNKKIKLINDITVHKLQL